MAIKKIKELDNGTSGEYWVAQASNNMVSKQTDVLMLLFKDKASRDEGKTFLLRERVPSIDGIYLTGEQVYAGVKASNLVEVEPAIEAVEDKEPVVEESNWFADAEDIL
jgi:hypothetical protein